MHQKLVGIRNLGFKDNMYDYMRGKVISISPQITVLEVGSIGFRISIPLSLSDKLIIGAEMLLFTSWVIKETSQNLYGFLEKKERDLFELLITVSGVGPKMALSLLGHLSVASFEEAIQNSQIQILSKVPGIGKKTAERLIVELRGKRLTENVLTENHGGALRPIHDAVSALVNLGYSYASAEQAIRGVIKSSPDISDLSQMITLALRTCPKNSG
jgi:Holliday junction DNA helicase RuvA